MSWVGPVLARETFDRLEAAIVAEAGPLDQHAADDVTTDGMSRPADDIEPPD